MIELGVIFTIATSATETVTLAADLLEAVKRIIGEVDSLDEKVDRLLSSNLNAGFQHLKQAARADSEQNSLLRDARRCFNLAVELEKGYRKGLALLGLAVCYHLLRERANCRDALERLVSLPPAISEWAIVGAVLRDPDPEPGKLKSLYYDERIKSAIQRSSEARSLLKLQETAAVVLNGYYVR
jgi:hypothetical protein